MSFDDDFRLTATDTEGTWSITLAERWNVGRNQNGGALLLAGAAGMREVSGHPDPLTVTAHYVAAGAAGDATVEAAAIKPGRTYSSCTAGLHQDGRERTRTVGAFGDLSIRHSEGQSLLPAPPPTIPELDYCTDLFEILTAGPAGERALTKSIRNFEMRVRPDGGWGDGDAASMDGWVRMRDEDTVSSMMLLLMADAYPPSLMSVAEVGWVPTIELTVHVLARPVADEPWLQATLRTRTVAGGLVAEDGEFWDASGQLVARFRQLALVVPRDR